MNSEAGDINKHQTTEEALKDSQTELLALFNAIEDVILVVSAEGKYLKVAPSSAPSLYKPPAEILGKTVQEVFPPAFADYFLHHMKQTLTTKKTVKIEYSLPISDQEVWFEASIAAMGEDSVVIVARDINDRKLMERQLRQQAQDLEQTLQELKRTQSQMIHSEKMSSLGQLVAGIAHEINNPVNFIHGNINPLHEYIQNLFQLIELYQEYDFGHHPEIQKFINKIDLESIKEDLPKTLNSMNVGTQRIRQIVLSLRTFSRMDEAKFKKVDIHEGINSTLMLLKHSLQEIEVITNYGDLPLVKCYAGELNQVFMNILVNAIDAIEQRNYQLKLPEIQANPGRIQVWTKIVDSQWIEIAIADNGIGMTEQVKKQMFNPFFTTKPVGKGTGLGMSISYQIISERHGGKLQCYSTPGKGAKFVIQIPIYQ
ncbi:PAS domain-containing protein [Anabaena catenula FACHB-362]|uniref:histidine kinase n=1 Tax=Anabaena catenula FACHB-362 TaxID=2692877 RepID=A0ABR8JCS0_9NOST|nr:ATP-binding protein [Anabaena catenula]MBD2695195.1 PAS domain-containing protein [Anabaena catenula FACHB-362]